MISFASHLSFVLRKLPIGQLSPVSAQPAVSAPASATAFVGSDRPLVERSEVPNAQHRGQGIKPPQGYILIVDDEELIRQVAVRSCVRYLGMDRDSLLTAPDISSALALYYEYEGSLLAVVSDVDMGRVDEGYALYHTLRHKRSYEGPYVLMSGRPQGPDHIDSFANDPFPTCFFEKNPPPWKGIAAWLRALWARGD